MNLQIQCLFHVVIKLYYSHTDIVTLVNVTVGDNCATTCTAAAVTPVAVITVVVVTAVIVISKILLRRTKLVQKYEV